MVMVVWIFFLFCFMVSVFVCSGVVSMLVVKLLFSWMVCFICLGFVGCSVRW